MNTLVTGGGGFLGRYVVEQLLARGDRVRILSRGTYPDLERLGVDSRRGDVRDAAAVRSACEGVETVFHTAAVSGIWGPYSHYHSINTVGTENVVSACRDAGVLRLVYTSSPSVIYDGQDHCDADETLPYPQKFLCHYPHTKMLAEQRVLAANGPGLATCALRPHLIWGPRDNHLIPRLIARARSGHLRQVGDGRNLISTSYVENAAAAHLQAADRLAPGSPVAGQAYFINEPEPVPLWGWINTLLSRAGMSPVRRRISLTAATALGQLFELTWSLLRLSSEPPMTRFLAAQLGGSHYYSIRKARRAFGYSPVVTVDQGLAKLEPELRLLSGVK